MNINLASALGATLLAGCVSTTTARSFDSAPIPGAWRPDELTGTRATASTAGGPGSAGSIPSSLTPWDAARVAVERNPELRALRAERGVARAEIIAAGVLPNPTLAGHFSVPLAGAEATVYGAGADLSWDVSPLIGMGARLTAAEESFAAIDLEVAWQEWQVATGARLHASRSIFLQRRIAIAQQVEASWETRVAALEAALARGAVTALELRDATSSLAEAQMARRALEREHAVELGGLATAIGVDSTELPSVVGDRVEPARPPAVEGLLRALPDRRLDLIALRHRYRGHSAALDAAHAAAFPPIQIGVFVNQEVDENLSAGPTLSIGLPIFDRNQAQIARQEAVRERTGDEYDARLQRARADVLALHRQLEIIAAELAAATEAGEQLTDLAERARRAHASGALTLLRAHELERRAWAAQIRRAELEQLRAELRVGLAAASGDPL